MTVLDLVLILEWLGPGLGNVARVVTVAAAADAGVCRVFGAGGERGLACILVVMGGEHDCRCPTGWGTRGLQEHLAGVALLSRVRSREEQQKGVGTGMGMKRERVCVAALLCEGGAFRWVALPCVCVPKVRQPSRLELKLS